jgi:hypothetical protein
VVRGAGQRETGTRLSLAVGACEEVGVAEWRRERGRAHEASWVVVAGEVGARSSEGGQIRADLPDDWAISSAFNLQRCCTMAALAGEEFWSSGMSSLPAICLGRAISRERLVCCMNYYIGHACAFRLDYESAGL